MKTSFIGERITELRLKKGVSEYQMSYDLGHNKNYVRAITSGRSLPSVDGLFAIIEYFEMRYHECYCYLVSSFYTITILSFLIS